MIKTTGGHMKTKDKIYCLNPNPGKAGTNIDFEKYLMIKHAIIKALEKSESGILFRDLPRHVEDLLTEEELAYLGSPGWYTTTVKLDLKTRGVIKRVPGENPQRLVLSK
jgi:hypothetical protein